MKSFMRSVKIIVMVCALIFSFFAWSVALFAPPSMFQPRDWVDVGIAISLLFGFAACGGASGKDTGENGQKK